MQIIRVRLISSVKTKGCEDAPVEILKELKNLNSKQNLEEFDFGNFNLEEIHVNINNIDEANYLIFENCKKIFEKSSKAFYIGGDHSISYSIIRAFEKIYNNPFLIVFDAHGGCKDNNLSDNWLKNLIKEGFRGDRVILISSRNLEKEEIEFIKKNKIILIGMDLLNDLEEVCDLVMERARNNDFYISIDIDSIDPAFAPGTGNLEPGGLTSRELIYFIKRLSLLKSFKGAEIVNISPKLDLNRMTIKLGAKLLAEMINEK